MLNQIPAEPTVCSKCGFYQLQHIQTGSSVLEGGKQLVAPSNYLALGCAGYAALTFMVWLNAFGKFPAKALAWSLIVWVVVGLWIPGFWLMATGKLPF
ncbi:MAG: hypothetical protein ABF291_04175 [Desulfobacterales bacterium]